MIDDPRWAWCDGPHYPINRDPRADDPDYYYRSGQDWVKKNVWTVENEPSCEDHEEYMRFLEETTPEERSLIRAERRRRYDQEQEGKGLVRWQNAWVTPKRRDELRETYLDNMQRSNEAMRRVKQMMSSGGLSRWHWC